MSRYRWASLVGLAAALAALAACDRPKARRPAPASDLPPVARRAAQAPPAPFTPPSAKLSNDALPRPPSWVGSLLGKPAASTFSRSDGQCVGNTDLIDVRYVGATQGVKIEGWGWDRLAKVVVARIVLVDKDGQVVGGGGPGVPRPDVMAARPEVTSPASGWTAVTPVTSGVIRALGVVGDGQVTCPLGQIDLGG